MQKIIFSEEFCRPELLQPFSLIRQVQDLRIGILSIREKWEQELGLPSFDRALETYKDAAGAVQIDAETANGGCVMIHANLLPSPALVAQVKALKPGECIVAGSAEPVIYYFTDREIKSPGNIRIKKSIRFTGLISSLHHPWELFQWNNCALREDFMRITAGRRSEPVPATCLVSGDLSNIFIEPGATLEHAILNVTEGPVYIGKNALIMDGACIRGPVAILEGAVVKMRTTIYGASCIGKYCTVGGEIKNSLIYDCSNKGHDGYLGDSVIGEWCNLGAGTSNSNMKNNASAVRLWTPEGQQKVGIKAGLLMGDYSKAAINTSFNTGTVVGICCNVVATGLTPGYIPSFSWGADGIERYKLAKALRDIRQWKKTKNKKMSAREKTILTYIFEHY